MSRLIENALYQRLERFQTYNLSTADICVNLSQQQKSCALLLLMFGLQ